MDLIDTHCHLYLPEFEADISELIQRAEYEGVKRFYLPAIDRSWRTAIDRLVLAFPGKCFAMEGLHPGSVKEDYETELKAVEDSLASGHFSAVGEIGLDFYWDRTYTEEQYEAFNRQIQWAKDHKLPIVIHSRQSIAETIKVVSKQQDGSLRGIFHCFNEDLESARAITALGFRLGIGGVLTYKNSRLPEVLKQIGLQHLVLETDSPYLPPVPFRGKRNESGYLVYIAAKLAEVKGISVEEVAETTTASALEIFGN
jgi:TatD DNase family protein